MANVMPSGNSVSQEVEMHIILDGGSLPMPCTLGYSVADPFAVSAAFRSGDGVVTWSFARDLLIEGMAVPSGVGDIRIAPVHAVGGTQLRIELSSPAGNAVLVGPIGPVAEFVAKSLDMLPQGYEWQHLNFDTGLAELLNGGGTF